MTSRSGPGSPGYARRHESNWSHGTRLRLDRRAPALRVSGHRDYSPTDIPIDQLIELLGLVGPDARSARAALEAAGLTNPRKRNISTRKFLAAQRVMDATFQRLCRNCVRRTARDHRALAHVPDNCCERCGGTNNGRAAQDLVAACQRANIRKALFVGGSPSFRQELGRLIGDELELRLIDGTKRLTKATARNDMYWAHVVVVCGGTELAHHVSTLYTRDPAARGKLVVTARRGIEAIADDVVRSSVVSGLA